MLLTTALPQADYDMHFKVGLAYYIMFNRNKIQCMIWQNKNSLKKKKSNGGIKSEKENNAVSAALFGLITMISNEKFNHITQSKM